jgi:hypothetical protein
LLVCISRAGKDLASGCAGVLLVSPYNVAWRSYVQAGGLEVSEFCFFLVFSSAKCSSSVSAIFDLWSSHCLFPPSSCHLGFPPGQILNKEILLRDVFCSYLTVLAFFRCEQLKEGTIF